MASSPAQPQPPEQLSSSQAHALLDILSHDEVYREILDFRNPDILSQYGPPFQDKSSTPSSTPSLQALVSRFVLNLPGLRDVSDDFWRLRISSILTRFQQAELSESYDKGGIGIRKSLATAASALIEYPVRGVFAGFDEPSDQDVAREYDLSNSQDIQAAFKDLLRQAVYGHIVDDLFLKIGETDQLADHTHLVQAGHEYGLVNLASFTHYALIISPKGQSLLTLIDHANKLIPYTLIKQTLRIGNVATMINAMVRVVLAKMSVSSVTNWMGWTQNADEGMNLLQHIISQVLHWDVRDLKHRASKIEKDKHSPSREQLHALKDYAHLSREQHQSIREASRSESKSIVFVILSRASVSTELTHDQHQHAQEYLAIQLSIWDRDQIVQVLCHSQPDHLSDAVRDLVATYEPLIRQLHQAVDLSETVSDFESWLRDAIKLAKISSSKKSQHAPTVGDFVSLYHKHQGSLHRFLHQVVKNGTEITSWFHEYALQAASHFRRTSATAPASHPNAGDLSAQLNALFAALPASRRTEILPILDTHATYLSTLHAASAARLHAVVTSPPSHHPAFAAAPHFSAAKSASQPSSRSASPGPGAPSSPLHAATPAADPGPGAFLARWQALVDASELTPGTPHGPVRSGTKGGVLRSSKTAPAAPGRDNANEDADDDDDDNDVFEEAREQLLPDGEGRLAAQDVALVVEALGPAFREMLGERAVASAP